MLDRLKGYMMQVSCMCVCVFTCASACVRLSGVYFICQYDPLICVFPPTQTGMMLSKPNLGSDDKPMTPQVSTNRPYKVFRQSNLIPLILTFHHCDYLAIDSAACHQSVMNRTRSFTFTM